MRSTQPTPYSHSSRTRALQPSTSNSGNRRSNAQRVQSSTNPPRTWMQPGILSLLRLDFQLPPRRRHFQQYGLLLQGRRRPLQPYGPPCSMRTIPTTVQLQLRRASKEEVLLMGTKEWDDYLKSVQIQIGNLGTTAEIHRESTRRLEGRAAGDTPAAERAKKVLRKTRSYWMRRPTRSTNFRSSTRRRRRASVS